MAIWVSMADTAGSGSVDAAASPVLSGMAKLELLPKRTPTELSEEPQVLNQAMGTGDGASNISTAPGQVAPSQLPEELRGDHADVQQITSDGSGAAAREIALVESGGRLVSDGAGEASDDESEDDDWVLIA